jgi:predicted MFS family arabinose efflux permease
MSEEAVALPGLTPKERLLSLTTVIACVSVFGLTVGLSAPLLALILEARGTDSTLIGLNAAMTAVGILVTSPFVPVWARMLGMSRLILLAMAVTALAFLLLKAWPNIWVWFPLRFLLGAAINILYVLSEAWIVQVAHEENRGRIVGLYTTVMAAGFGLGPLVIPITGSEGWAPFLVAVGLIALATLPIFKVSHLAPPVDEGAANSVVRFLPRAPMLLACVAVFGLIDGVSFSLLPIFGLRNGFDEATVAYMLAVLVFGSVALQVPIGWLSDKLNQHGILLFCTAVGVIGPAALPFTLASPALMWPTLFLWGGCIAGIYTISLAMLGGQFSGSDLVAGNAAFGLAWGFGSMVGPAAGGAAIEMVGVNGVPAVMGLACVLLAAYILVSLLAQIKGDATKS